MEPNTYILYAEENEGDAFLMRDIINLEQPVKSLCTVANGFEIIKHLQQVKKGAPYPSLIILNINMPVLKGKDTLELLKTDDIYRLIPVVMFSENENVDDALFYKRLNTEVYIKPTNFSEWKEMLHKVCESCL